MWHVFNINIELQLVNIKVAAEQNLAFFTANRTSQVIIKCHITVIFYRNLNMCTYIKLHKKSHKYVNKFH